MYLWLLTCALYSILPCLGCINYNIIFKGSTTKYLCDQYTDDDDDDQKERGVNKEENEQLKLSEGEYMCNLPLLVFVMMALSS